MTRHTRPDGLDGGSNDARARAGARSRRAFLRTIGAGAGVAVLGGFGTAAAREVDGDRCLSDGAGETRFGDVTLYANDWSTSQCPDPPVEICLSTYSDGSFGWEWERGVTCVNGDDLPNYPEALMGTKMGGGSSGWSDQGALPQRVADIDRFDVELDVEMDLSDGEWNFALECWMDPNPGIPYPATDEIMVVIDDSAAHDKGENEVTAAFEDDYGNVYDYWENDIEPGDGDTWNFHIFHLPEPGVPPNLDLRSLLDYLQEDPDGAVAEGGGVYDGSKYVGGVEIGNENWDETHGETVVNQFSVRVNDTVGAAGVRDDFTVHEIDDTAPTTPGSVTVDDRQDRSATVSWDASSDADSGVAEYAITVEGSEIERVGAETTATTISDLSADKSYEVGVTAIDGSGNRSETATVTVPTAGPGLDPIEGTVPQDLDGDGLHRDINGNDVVDFPDVNRFFQHTDSAAVQDHVDAYDFTGDGVVDPQDVLALFELV
ncbi:fibronectin type III domain-containing protein [Halococcoides cellulosivorans]|nr:fibronectin type III domain-containing protein [Halococcoides cellulosivorans]